MDPAQIVAYVVAGIGVAAAVTAAFASRSNVSTQKFTAVMEGQEAFNRALRDNNEQLRKRVADCEDEAMRAREEASTARAAAIRAEIKCQHDIAHLQAEIEELKR